MNKTSVLYLRGGFKDEMFQNVGKFRITRPFLLMKLPQMFFGIIFVFKWPPDNEYNIFEHSWLSYSTESDSKNLLSTRFIAYHIPDPMKLLEHL